MTWLRKFLNLPLSSWPVIDLSEGEPGYAMQGVCNNCHARVMLVQREGRSMPKFTGWGGDKPECPRCGVRDVHATFDAKLENVDPAALASVPRRSEGGQ